MKINSRIKKWKSILIAIFCISLFISCDSKKIHLNFNAGFNGDSLVVNKSDGTNLIRDVLTTDWTIAQAESYEISIDSKLEFLEINIRDTSFNITCLDSTYVNIWYQTMNDSGELIDPMLKVECTNSKIIYD